MENVIKVDLWRCTKAGITDHPKKVIESLGMKCLKFEPYPIGDAVFMEVDNIPDNLPSYIERSEYKLIK